MAGRDRNPYEVPIVEAYRNVDAFLSRIQRAAITDVDESKGTCTVSFDATSGSRSGVILPFYVHASVKGKRNRTAWQRFMPQVGDFVLVGFDSNSTARIVGFDMLSYETITAIQEEEGKFGWRDLKGGEFDMKSSGGAYLKGDATGGIFIAGGMTSLRFDKKRNEATLNAPTYKQTVGMSTIRSGLVRRSPLPLMPEANAKATIGVLPDPPGLGPASAIMGDLFEHTVDLRGSSAPSDPVALKVALMSLGNVMDPDFSLPVGDSYGAVGPAGIKKFKCFPAANARFLFQIYNSVPLTDMPLGIPGPIGGSPLRPFEWGIDQMGNSYMNVSSAAPQGFNLWSPTFSSISSMLNCMCGMVYLGGSMTIPPAGNIAEAMVGGGVVCGNPFLAAMTAVLGALTAFSGVAATGAAVTTPVDAVAYCKALGAAGTALSSALGGANAAFALSVSKSVFASLTPGIINPALSQFPL